MLAGLLLLGALGLVARRGRGPLVRVPLGARHGGHGRAAFPSRTRIAGQIVHVALIVLGVGTLFYALATVTEFFVAGHLGELLAARRMQKMIDSLTDHHIICGFGRVGRQVARDLRAARAKYVVIDSNTENRELARGRRSCASSRATRLTTRCSPAPASRGRARSSPARTPTLTTSSSRSPRASCALTSRSSRARRSEDSEKKLKRAGADRVISPYKSSGTEMARLALHPQLSGVVDVDAEYRMEEILVREGCEGSRQSVGDIRGGAMIVGLRRDSRFQPQPPGDIVLLPGDVVDGDGHAHGARAPGGSVQDRRVGDSDISLRPRSRARNVRARECPHVHTGDRRSQHPRGLRRLE